MANAPKDDETEFNETLKRMLDTKPKPHKPSDDDKGENTPKRSPAMRAKKSDLSKK